MGMSVTTAVGETAPSRGRFGALHSHRFLMRAGFGLVNVFAWIFVFQYFYLWSGFIPSALIATVLMYCIAQVSTIILTPLSAVHLRRGVKHSIVYGALLAGAAYIYLGATLAETFNGEPVGWGIAVFALLLGGYRALYWVPYQLKASTENAERSRMPIFYEIVIAVLPAFAGITLVSLPFAPMRILFGSAVFMALSVLPLLALRDAFEGFSWNYWQTFRELVALRHRKILASSLIQGAQGTALFLLWPIAVFLIVGTSYQALGIIVSITLFAVLILRKVYRYFVRKMKLENSAAVHTAVSVSGWILRIFAGTPAGVIVADTYSYVTAPRHSHSIDPFTFEQAADSGSYVDEYTVLKEIGLALGRIIACAIFALFLLWLPLASAFAAALILAAIFSAVSVVLDRTASPSVY